MQLFNEQNPAPTRFVEYCSNCGVLLSLTYTVVRRTENIQEGLMNQQ